MRARAGRETGFTLLEVLAVLLLFSLVVGVALDFYVDLSNQSSRATEGTRDVRRATSLLDRVARDLERTLLVTKPPETDPLAHPWVFVAESHLSPTGSDRVKFVSRQPVRRGATQTADLEMVSYALEPDTRGDGRYDLVRWSSPALPESLDRSFPPQDDPAAFVLASGVGHFAMRFLDDSGQWLSDWDSSQILESSALPVAVELEVAMVPLEELTPEEAEQQIYRRRVFLPVRPLDLETLLDPEAQGVATGEEEAGADCEGLTVRDCIDFEVLGQNRQQLQQAAAQGIDLEGMLDASWCSIQDAYRNHPAVRPECR